MFETVNWALGRKRSVVLQVSTVVTKSPFDIETTKWAQTSSMLQVVGEYTENALMSTKKV